VTIEITPRIIIDEKVRFGKPEALAKLCGAVRRRKWKIYSRRY